MKSNTMINVDNVSMKFRMGSDNIMSLKELIIAKIKKKVSYKDFWVFKDINFEVKKGEVVGIVGRNGAGKSTLLKIISGILQPTEGKVELQGRVVPMLELGSGFDYDLTGRENIFLNGSILGYSEEFLKDKYDDILEFSELGEFIESPIRNYSSGMLMRLAFSIATIVEPEILIVDEILAVGDEAFQKKSKRKMLELMGGGTTVLFVSHSIAQIREMCNRVVWLEKGKIKMIGDAKFVCDEYQKYINPTGEVQDKKHKASDAPRNLSDVLFVYGDDEEKYKWRVTSLREQLLTGTVPSNEIYYKDIKPEIAKLYRSYIFVNCERTPQLVEFIEKIKYYNKKVYFDFSDCGQKDTDEGQRKLLQEIDSKCDGIIVSNKDLEKYYKDFHYQVIYNPLSVTEQVNQYASWAIYDRDVLPLLDTKNLTEDELINYNKAKALQTNREKHQLKIGLFMQTLHDVEILDRLFIIDKCLNANPSVELTVADSKMYVPQQLGNYTNQIKFIQVNNDEDMVRECANVDVQVIFDSEQINIDYINKAQIYGTLVKIPTILISENSLEIENVQCVSLEDSVDSILRYKEKTPHVSEEEYKKNISRCTTLGTGDIFAQFIRSDMTPNFVILIENNNIGGNNWLACQHAVIAKEQGRDVSIIVSGKQTDNIIFYDCEIPVISRDLTYSFQYMDKMVSYDWSSARWMQNYSNVTDRYYVVCGDEKEKLNIGDTMRFYANQMYTPHTEVQFITTSEAIKDWLENKFNLEIKMVPVGLKKGKRNIVSSNEGDRKRLLIMGDGEDIADNLSEAFEIADKLPDNLYEKILCTFGRKEAYDFKAVESYHNPDYKVMSDIYDNCDILILSYYSKDYVTVILEALSRNIKVIVKKNEFENTLLGKQCIYYNNVTDAVEKIDMKGNATETELVNVYDRFNYQKMVIETKKAFRI